MTQLPYFVSYPIQSPSGKAVFQIQNPPQGTNSIDYVDLVVCRFPEPGGLRIPDGTVTAYRYATAWVVCQCACIVCVYAKATAGVCSACAGCVCVPRD